MAPFAPFLSEHIFQEIKDAFGETMEESVHLCDYPTYNEGAINSSLEDAVARMQEIILLGRQKRNQAEIKVKTPLSKLTIIHQDQSILDGIASLEEFIKIELNVKDIAYDSNEDKHIKLYAKPNARVLGKKLGERFKSFFGPITKLESSELKKVEAGQSINVNGKDLLPEDLLIYREAQKGSEAISNRWISIELNTTLTDELIDEGLAREVVNRIQRSRKDFDFNVDDRIKITIETTDKLKSVIQKHQDYIQSETLCEGIAFEETNKENNYVKHDIEKNDLHLSLSR
jgi:isoleucyl-tRNA synthetase